MFQARNMPLISDGVNNHNKLLQQIESNQFGQNLYAKEHLDDSQFELVKNKKNFTVAVRIKPELNFDIQTLVNLSIKKLYPQNQELKLILDGKKFEYGNYGQNNQKKFVFDRIFQAHSQNAYIFQSLISKKLNLMKKGVNLSIMAYGATNSGKTYTIFGKKSNQLHNNSEGLSYLSFKRIFQLYQEDYQMSFSFVQIYNQSVFDLLNSFNLSTPLNVMQDCDGNTNVIGLRKVQISSIQQIYTLISQGNNARTSCSNIHNIHSSRSHAFMEMEIKNRITKQKTRMIIVDLAGSQKYIYNSVLNNGSNILKQGSNINKSLLSLGNCIKGLYENEQHIPYRDSKLTRLLKENLNGFAHNIMIACINTKLNHFEENVNSLNYALKAMKIQKEITRKLQIQQISEYQCSNCHQKLTYSLIKEINKHEKHKQRVKTRQSQSLSVSPISKFEGDFCGFKSKAKNSAMKMSQERLSGLIDETFKDLISKLYKSNRSFEEVQNILSQQKQKLKKEIKSKLCLSMAKTRDSQGQLNRSIDVSEFQHNFKQKDIGRSNQTQMNDLMPTSKGLIQRKLKISLSKPKKPAQKTEKSIQPNQFMSMNSVLANDNTYKSTHLSQDICKNFHSTNNHIKIEDQNSCQQSFDNSSGLHSFRSNLTVQILDDKQKILNQRRKVLEQSAYNQRRNSSLQSKSILKFKSAQNQLKNKNIQAFMNQITADHPSNKIQYKKSAQLAHNYNRCEDLVQQFDPFIIGQRLLDSTTIAPRMRRDEEQAGAWKNIFIKNVQSPLNQSSLKPSFEQSFVQQKICVQDRKQNISRVFRY